MPSKLQIDQVDVAMVALGQDSLKVLCGEPIDVASLGNDDFTDEGDLILRSPSVRIRFVEGAYSPSRDTQKLTYNAGLQFAAMVYSENLRSRNDERLDSLKLLGNVLECYAGARLKLEDGSFTEPIELLSASPVMNEDKVIDQYYAAVFRVPGIAQFGGTNARFGEK